MPTRVQLPGGDTATFPDGMSTEAIERVLREQYKPAEPPDANYSNEGRTHPTPTSEPTLRDTIVAAAKQHPYVRAAGAAADLGVGLVHGTAHMATMLDKAASRAGWHSAKPQSTEWIDEPYKQASPVAAVGSMVPSAVASTVIPGIGAAGKVGLAVDVGANALYGGLEGYGEGRDFTDSALVSGLGAAGGRFVARAMGGSKDLVSKDARQLIDAGVMPTPGQLGGDGLTGRMVRAVEDRVAGVPVVGEIIQRARKRSLEDYTRAEINAALKPLLEADSVVGKKLAQAPVAKGIVGSAGVRDVGTEGVEQAMKKISSAYDSALDGMHVSPKFINDALGSADEAIEKVPMLDSSQVARLENFIQLRIKPHMDSGGLTGEYAKRLDAEIGSNARRFMQSPNPTDHALGEAYYELQHSWRDAMAKGARDGNATDLLNRANESFRSLLPVVRASDKALAQGGVFSPFQMGRASQQDLAQVSGLTRAAQNVLPATVPDSGTAGRLLLAGTIGGGALIPGHTATGALLAGLAYSRPGIRMIVNGMGDFIPASVRRGLLEAAPEEAVEMMKRLAQTNPMFAKQLAAQLGRHAAASTMQGEGEQE